MAPRAADERIGYFTVERRNLSRPFQKLPEEFIQRWRLEPGERDGALWRPRRPITYYLDPAIPKELVPTVREGVLAWNRAFQAAGWKDAITVSPLSVDDERGELRRAVIRWVITEGSARNGQARTIADPRTGEVLGARIVLDALSIKRDFDKGRFLVDSPLPVRPELSPKHFAPPLMADSLLLGTALPTQGSLSTLAPLPAQILVQRLRSTVMHEVGHTLGLCHNFRASADVPNERLSDVPWLREHGLSSSVMDYTAMNLPLTVEGLSPDFPFYNLGLGDADPLLITYGYAADEGVARQALRTFVERGYSLATDSEDSAANGLDPLVNQHDLGNDVLAWARGRADFIRSLWPRLPQRMLIEGQQYGELNEAVLYLLGEYFSKLTLTAKYVGGQYRVRDRVRDPGGRRPFVPIAKDKQRGAVELLLNYVFTDNPLQLSQELLSQLGGPLTGPKAMHYAKGQRFDFPIYELLRTEQLGTLRKLIDPLRQQRMMDAEFKFGVERVLTVAELYSQVSAGLFSEIWTGAARAIPPLRRELQCAYIELLGGLLWGGSERVPSDAQASALFELNEILRRIEPASRATALLLPTQTHLRACVVRIRALLDPAKQPRSGS